MADQSWTLAMVILANCMSIIITLFSNRSGKRDKEIEQLDRKTDKLFEKTDEIPIIKENLRLFREECIERHNIKRKRKV
jgi:hypothetical protein